MLSIVSIIVSITINIYAEFHSETGFTIDYITRIYFVLTNCLFVAVGLNTCDTSVTYIHGYSYFYI
ncbi:hypothetical protein BDA99DRAFT_303324 [Phascolomyces articulosus]|uniref:Uncharacterized protein n=1 Tax=Phascolomyces articulosus TaxID=60185 RepID=A0AAD5KIC8_9FUNG|nr:hypothetical protein BDA99DRAFT_303324 [Phascolomyces articulosus]